MEVASKFDISKLTLQLESINDRSKLIELDVS